MRHLNSTVSVVRRAPVTTLATIATLAAILSGCASFSGIDAHATLQPAQSLETALSLPDQGGTWPNTQWPLHFGGVALQVLVDERLAERAEKLGVELVCALRALNSPLIIDVRGMGLLVGVEIDAKFASAREVCEVLLRHGVLSKDTHHTVVRFAPPLTMNSAELAEAMISVKSAFVELEKARVKKVA